MHSEDEHTLDFGTGGAGASLTYPLQCSALRKSGHVVIKGRPCKIVEISVSKTGKHGHAKVHLIAIDVGIFTQKKLEDLSPSTHNMDVPHVKRVDWNLVCRSFERKNVQRFKVNIDDGYLNLLSPEGNEQKDDVKLPESDLGKEIEAAFEDGRDLIVTIVSAMGEEHCLAYKDAPKGS
ncbi:Eukaryotic translation initiation factor 5A-1 [Neolecta irregularis DAH-3]|uniref:Eukaryotic translation initiation factor 5A n=1 Tax=Neolecta irregularis (strain DAH-3) TaxID=1198029 RepID=A0A1U7LWG5_NEOID|nr:Eukaryotic translation initiation factor 5A-1 [Neolecta irregularis DAH-3]|eukprot:OLL27020.1 Eukaryotic translation initiation factor 5A-1 [Neolecta irregularis DAH-3]